jgi:flagellin
VYERLSSGQRINRASDDAAGLAIASSLNTSKRVYTQAIRNINDGLSSFRIAEGAVRELTSVVGRIQELAEQSANGLYSTKQRAALDREPQALRDEFNRVIDTTIFNGVYLLNGSTNGVDLQVGTNSAASSRISVKEGRQNL